MATSRAPARPAPSAVSQARNDGRIAIFGKEIHHNASRRGQDMGALREQERDDGRFVGHGVDGQKRGPFANGVIVIAEGMNSNRQRGFVVNKCQAPHRAKAHDPEASLVARRTTSGRTALPPMWASVQIAEARTRSLSSASTLRRALIVSVPAGARARLHAADARTAALVS